MVEPTLSPPPGVADGGGALGDRGRAPYFAAGRGDRRLSRATTKGRWDNVDMTFVEAMRILAAFERHGVAYVLVGSMAMAAQGIVRATRDIDVFVAADPSNVELLKAALREVFDDPEIDCISAADLEGEYPAIQYVPPQSDYWIDILARLGEAVRYADLESEVVQIEGICVRVATPRMLHRMKRDTVRPQDRADAQVLKQRFGLEDD